MKIEYDNIQFDSQEEVNFYIWLKEAKKAGYVKYFEYHTTTWEITERQTYPKIIHLKTKAKIVQKFLLSPLTYTLDFVVKFNDKFFKEFPDHGLVRVKKMAGDAQFSLNETTIAIDVKGPYNQNDAHRRFSIMQKLVYARTGYFVNMVIPQGHRQGKVYKRGFFERTWVPEEIAFISNRKVLTRRKPFAKCVLLKEHLENYNY